MASSVLLLGGGGFDGGDGFFFSSRPNNNNGGRESLGRLGKLGNSMIDRETSSERSLTMGGGGSGFDFLVLEGGGDISTVEVVEALEAKGLLEIVIVGVRFRLLLGSEVGVDFFSGSGDGGDANLSLNPGMKRPVVVASVSNSSSSSFDSFPSSLLAAAKRQCPLLRIQVLVALLLPAFLGSPSIATGHLTTPK